jgi:hypothetical protein
MVWFQVELAWNLETPRWICTPAYFSEGNDEDPDAYFSEFKAVGIPVSRSNSVLGVLEDEFVMW